jgi:hypothetical protein
MPAFPSYVKLGWRDNSEHATPVVIRSEMERGFAKQRRIATDAIVTQTVTLYFMSTADSLAFEAWFYSAAGGNAGAAWFDMRLPRVGVVSARIVGGDLGTLKPLTAFWAVSERSVQIEYLRSAL